MNLFIMSGLSGSGKSTLARELVGKDGLVCSADDYFMEDGVYNWDAKQIPMAHVWNQQRVSNALDEKIPNIAIDNTNTSIWELRQLKFLVTKAQKMGYNVEIKRPTTPWAFNAEELAKRNTHGVPLETIQKKLKNFAHDATVDDILNSLPVEEK